MFTVNGKIENASGVSGVVEIVFTPRFARQIQSSSLLTGCQPFAVTSDDEGVFETDLRVGDYDVLFRTSPKETVATIRVTEEDGEGDFNTLVITDDDTVVYTPSGHGSPEGVVPARPGQTYLDVDSGSFWSKRSGTGNTGWIELIA